MKRPLLASASLVAFVAFVSGCATSSSLANSMSVGQVNAAISSHRYAKLKDLCTGKIKIRSKVATHQDDACAAAIKIAERRRDKAFLAPLCSPRKEGSGLRFAAACPAMLFVAIRTGDTRAINTLCYSGDYDAACMAKKARAALGDLAHPHCATLAQKFAEARQTVLKSKDTSPSVYGVVVAALAKCGDAKLIFDGIAHLGQAGEKGYGTRVLVAADEFSGGAFARTFYAYLRKNRGRAFLSGQSAESARSAGNHISNWLLQEKRVGLCRRVVAAARGSADDAVAGLIPYFVATDCKKASPLAVRLLLSDRASMRVTACKALGKIGGMRDLLKVSTIADSDRTSRTVESPPDSGHFIKVFFVADACKQAANKIQLRGE